MAGKNSGGNDKYIWTECQCNYTVRPIPAYGTRKVFSVSGVFMKTFLKEHRACWFGEGGIGFFGITQNLLNKKLSVFPHSWRPIIATQIEKLEAERREIL